MSAKTRILAGVITAVVCMSQPVSTVLANPHYDRRMTVAEEEMVPAAGASGSIESRAALITKHGERSMESAITEAG